MASLPDYIVHGVQFKLSSVFTNGLDSFSLPSEFDLKDPDVLLEELEYNFSVEKYLIGSGENDAKLKENSEKKYSSPKKEKTKIKLPKQNQIETSDFHSSTKQDQKHRNSNYAKTMNLKDFEDALPHVQHNEKSSRDEVPKPRPRHQPRVESPVESKPKNRRSEEPEITVDHKRGVSKNKKKLLEDLADLLTDDVKQAK